MLDSHKTLVCYDLWHQLPTPEELYGNFGSVGVGIVVGSVGNGGEVKVGRVGTVVRIGKDGAGIVGDGLGIVDIER